MKLQEAQPSAILPSSLQQWNFPKNSLLPVLSQINTIACFVKVKRSDFQTRLQWLLALPASHDGSGPTFLCA